MRGWKRFSTGGFIVGLLIVGSTTGYAQATAPTGSVLQQGSWLKIGVVASGVYRLDQPTLVRINPAFAQIDPRLLRLYGNGGAMLPQSNAVPRAADLTENAVQVTGEGDGRFDQGDALLFFGQSPHVVRYDSTTRRFVHQTNVYTDTTFYFLTVGTAPGLRVATNPAGNTAGNPTVTSFTDYQFHELEQQKLPDVSTLPSLHSGREWLGEFMTLDTAKTIAFDGAGLIAGTPVRLRLAAVAGSRAPTRFAVRVNGQLAGAMEMSTVSGAKYDFRAQSTLDTFRIEAVGASSGLQATVSFLKQSDPSAQGYLDYIGIECQRMLQMPQTFRWARRLLPGRIAVGQATSSLRVWNVTNPLVPIEQAYVLSTSSTAQWQTAQQADYALFTDGQIQEPASIKPIDTQNLRAADTPDLLIVTAAAWQTEAQRLAAFRRDNDKLNVLVVTTQQVYNEFGSGQADPTAIRDAVRYFYRKQPGRLRYLLLMGDATYDYRNISRLIDASQLANMVPVYESRESLHPVLSYSSDDYYGFLDDREGEWPEIDVGGDYPVDLGIGRLPVKSQEEARTTVDKLIRYSTDTAPLGDWQTKVTLIADDGDYNTHQYDANQLAVQIENQSPAYEAERIFLDSYPQEVTADGPKAPVVKRLINQALQDGRLIINYNGHGGETGLAEEQIVTDGDILGWTNRRLPLFVTATCQFGRYDDPSVNSGAELALLNRSGGAVGLLTTTRPVFANTNLLVNQAFYASVFKPIDGQMPRLGDMMKATKNNSLKGPVNRNFALLGDPSQRLVYPQAQAVLTRVDSYSVEANRTDTLRALQTVALGGEIRYQNQLLRSFTGTARLVLYDKETTLTTLGTESAKMSYQAFTNTLFVGQVSVRNGQFAVRFTMPKDIDYTIGRARLYLYAIQADSMLTALGSYDGLSVGGSIATDSVDTQPPVVQVGVPGSTPDGEAVRTAGPAVTIRVQLRDNAGINIARAGLGHELTAQLDNQTPVVLNNSYVATGADGRQGEATYTFQNLLPGRYTVRVKAWDLSNNSGEGALTILVSEKPGLRIDAVQAMPNPVSTQTTLRATHNRPGESLDWTLSVYDPTGRVLSQQPGQCSYCAGSVEVGGWNGQSNTGQPMPNGVYVYRLKLRSETDGSTTQTSGRLVLLR